MTHIRENSFLVRFIRDECGAAMVEFAMVATLFFLMLFQILEFGVFTSTNVIAEKSTQVAARIATVRPPACVGVPDRLGAGTATPAPRAGTSCRAITNACAVQATVSCSGQTANATANEIWTRIAPSLPGGTQISDLNFTYAQDLNLGYVGGPYVPEVTVELTLPTYDFFVFIGAPQFRTISISLPGEDLAGGTNG